MIQRYDLEADCTVQPMNGDMYPNADGDYVTYEDHAARIAMFQRALLAMLKEYAPARDNLDPTTSTHAAAIAAYEALDHA